MKVNSQGSMGPSSRMALELLAQKNGTKVYGETKTTRTDFLVSAVIYLFDLLLCLLLLCYRRYRGRPRKRTISNTNLWTQPGNQMSTTGGGSVTLLSDSASQDAETFYENFNRLLLSPSVNAMLLTTAFLIRSLWCFGRAYDPTFNSEQSLPERLWNKLVLYLLFMSFGLILLKWIISLRQDGMPFAKRTFGVISIALFVEMLFMAIFHGGSLAENILISFVFLIMSIMFTGIGLTVRRRLNKFAQSTVVRTNSRRICITSNTCTILFLVRCFAYVYWPLSGYQGFKNRTVQRWYYPWLYYTIPESVNGLCVLYLMLPVSNTASDKDSRDNRIDSWTLDTEEADYLFADRNTGSGRGAFNFLPKGENRESSIQGQQADEHQFNDRISTVTYL